MSEVIRNISVIMLRGVTIFPYMVIHFDVSKKKEIAAIEYAMTHGQKVFVCDREEEPEGEAKVDSLEVGSIVEIKQIMKIPNGTVRVLGRGVLAAKVNSYVVTEKAAFANVETIEANLAEYDDITQSAYMGMLKDAYRNYAAGLPKAGADVATKIFASDNVLEVIYRIAAEVNAFQGYKKAILEEEDLYSLYKLTIDAVNRDIQVNKIKSDLMSEVKSEVDKHQKEYVLREQMRVIRESLGEDEDDEADEWDRQADALNAPSEVKDKLHKEIKRYRNLSGSSSEGNVVRTYIEELLSMPWDNESQDNTDLKNAMKVLDDDHYGLEKVKERIIELLAVRIYNQQRVLEGKATASEIDELENSSVICLVGPPGTGKTSIVRSIASALNRKYIRVCLGGVRDEAEIRGHRKTYVGAMPGRIAEGIKQAGVKNPVMLLDEIDKTGTDSRGDTASALLEVLDTAQNSRFLDHYLEVPLDLSKVLFVCTANDASAIPRPLFDRMDIIELSSYTENEKFHIAKYYLIPKSMKNAGLTSKDVAFADSAIYAIIRSYTREAGVRSLERKTADICRKVVKNKLTSETLEKAKITTKNLKDYLGKEKIMPDKAPGRAQVGVVTGLAWTSVGGDTLTIEVGVMPGKGELILTGNLGDVMKESARIALSFAKSVALKYGVRKDFFDKHNLHIHIPEGAVPKDGPSAGITLSTAIISAASGKAVKAKLAMTGEVTLRGNVLAIGGLKEKLLAAGTYGIKTVLVPAKNKPDIAELSEEITYPLEIIYVENMKEVLENALVGGHSGN